MSQGRAVGVVCTCLLAAATGAADAQASREVTSSVEIAMLRDDNVIWRPLPELDHVWRVTPGLQLWRESPRSRLFLDGEFDAERYQRLTELTSIASRQHALATWQFRPALGRTIDVDAGYDSSVNPTDLNVTTGIILGRLRGRQWYAHPTYTHAIDGRHDVVVGYRLGGEHTELTPRVLSQRAEVGVLVRPSARDEWYPSYTAEIFQFGNTSVRTAHLGVLRWSHRLTPTTRTTTAGGVRYYEGGLRPHVQLEADRRTGFVTTGVGYSWTQVTAIGVTALVDVQNLQADIEYGSPHGRSVFATAAYYHTSLRDERANVFRISGGGAIRLAGPLSLAVTSAIDYQRGRLQPSIPLVPVPSVRLGSAPVSIMAPPVGPLRRMTMIVALRLAGTSRSAAGPGPEQDADVEDERPRGGRRR